MSPKFFNCGLSYRQFGLIFVFCLMIVLASRQAYKVEAVANPLDTSFGSGGKVIYGYEGTSTVTRGAAVQPDGKMVVVGFTASGSRDDVFTVSRFNVNGSPDTSFSDDGIVTDRFSNESLDNSQANSVVVQPDGKILVAGRGKSGAKSALGLARFNPDGSYDTTFDGDGKANIAVSSSVDSEAWKMTLQPDGKIVLAGIVRPTEITTYSVVARINPNGSPDTTFSDDGFITYQESISSPGPNVFVQPDGKIRFVTVYGQGMTILRYNTDGTLDTTFGSNGAIVGLPGGTFEFQPDGKIVIGTTYVYYSDFSSDFKIYRFNADGSRDTSFGSNGEVLISVGDGFDSFGTLTLQPDGKIVAAGIRFPGSPSGNNGDLALARLNADGSPDSTFGTGGTVISAIGDGTDIPVKLIVRSNGKIFVAGVATRTYSINAGRGMLVTYRGDLNVADFDGDTRTDISIFRPSNGGWWYLKSSDGGNAALLFGGSADKLVPGDYTGDGKTDIAIFRPASGEWFVLRSEDNSFYAFPFGSSSDIPAVGDFDGDGKSDPGVYRPSAQAWYIMQSAGAGTRIEQFGSAGDVPVASDYDGDGKSDVAIYRPSNGQWWIRRSGDNSVIAFQFGTSSDKLVPGDYTGDGKTDAAFFRPSTGQWFILRSEDYSFYGVPFGTDGDSPAPGDYDGDGKFDISIFRPANAVWYINRSTAGMLITGFGAQGDVPVPSAPAY